jgi:NAD(P)-dependent dehydrogenase (short-subunit alcohol dehydrogenase family)
MKFQGRTAVVTGGSRGIGREIAKALAIEGAHIALAARSRDGLDESKRIIQAAGGEAIAIPTDLRDRNQIDKLIADVLRISGGVDIIVHAAGVWHDDKIVYAGVPLVSTPPEQIDEVLDVGIRAPMHLTRGLLPGMIQKKQGKIISISGTFASGGAGWLHYYVSKLALEHLTVGLAQELREHEIQVNCISPSDTDTEPLRRFFPDDAKSAISPVEIAKLAVFLASQEADHITGQCIVIKNKMVY